MNKKSVIKILKAKDRAREIKKTRKWATPFVGHYVIIDVENVLGTDGVYYVDHLDQYGLIHFQTTRPCQINNIGMSWQGHIRLAEPHEVVLGRLSGEIPA